MGSNCPLCYPLCGQKINENDPKFLNERGQLQGIKIISNDIPAQIDLYSDCGLTQYHSSIFDFEDEEDREVDVYIYLSVSEKLEESIDQYIKNLSDNKNKIIKDFEKAIKESSIDCSLNLTSTINNSEEEINCDI